MKSLFTNWKTTSAGLTMIAGSIVHLVFRIKAQAADENAWMISIGGVIGGVGLMFAGDASASQSKKDLPPADTNQPKPNNS